MLTPIWTYNILTKVLNVLFANDLAGASIAIAKEGNLVHAKGFYAKETESYAATMLRVASI